MLPMNTAGRVLSNFGDRQKGDSGTVLLANADAPP